MLVCQTGPLGGISLKSLRSSGEAGLPSRSGFSSLWGILKANPPVLKAKNDFIKAFRARLSLKDLGVLL